MIKFGRPVSVDVEARLPRLVQRLAEDDQVEAVWLFGSRARNEHDALSDVDLAVLARADVDASALWDRQLAWTRLAIEVLSPSTARHDRFTKRRLYQEVGIPAYWIVDPDERAFEVWTPDARFPTVERERVAWDPGGTAAFTVELAELFRPI